MFEDVDRFSSFDRSIEDSSEHFDLVNGQTSIEREFSPDSSNRSKMEIEKKDSSNLPNKYNKYNQNHQNQQNNRITRETITDELYRYTWEPTKKVWIVGTDDSTTYGNAVLLGYTNCPVSIEIAREKTHTDGKSYPVEIIGQRAFLNCARYDNYPTKTIFVTKQVKLIKDRGFGNENYLTNFTIESGSQLQSIEYYGLHDIGYQTARTNSLTKTLIFPPTLSSVAADGIYYCNLFEEIIYCGSHDLSTNSSTLYYNVAATILRVTTNYNFATLFGNTITASTGDKTNVVSSICQNFLPLRSLSFFFFSFPFCPPLNKLPSSAFLSLSYSYLPLLFLLLFYIILLLSFFIKNNLNFLFYNFLFLLFFFSSFLSFLIFFYE